MLDGTTTPENAVLKSGDAIGDVHFCQKDAGAECALAHMLHRGGDGDGSEF